MRLLCWKSKVKLPPPLLLLLQVVISCLAEVRSTTAAAAAKGNGSMRILALFSSTSNTELSIDHRLGQQVLKIAANRARQLYPTLSDLELLIESDETPCGSSNNRLAGRVVEHFYLDKATSCGSAANECARERQDDDLQELELYLNSSLTLVNRRAKRQESFSMKQLISKHQHRIDAIIGPSCDFLVDLIARMAAYWRTPVYSVSSISATFAQKDIYSTLTRLSPSLDQLSMLLVRTMQMFSWRHLAVLVDQKQALSSMILDNLERTLVRLRYLESNSTIIERRIIRLYNEALDNNNMKKTITTTNNEDTTQTTQLYCTSSNRWALLEARKVARVLLLLVDDPTQVRRLLLCAHELQMNDGEFTFLAFNLDLKTVAPTPVAAGATGAANTQITGVEDVASARQSKSTSGRALQSLDWYSGGVNEERANLAAREMFQSLMVLSADPLVSDQYNLFVEQTLEALASAHPDLRYERSSINSAAVALHDSLLLAVEAYLSSNKNGTFQKTTGEDDDDDDEQQWASEQRHLLFWDRHYANGLAAGLHINAQGDQELDYVLSDMEPEMGLMRPVASYSKEQRKLELLPESYIHWPKRRNALTNQVRDNDEPPPDEPECGFNGDAERCVDRQNLHAALSIITILAFSISACLLFSLFKYRHIRYQMQLDDYWWKVNWNELQFVQSIGDEGSLVSNAQSIARAALRSERETGAAGSVVSVQSISNKISRDTTIQVEDSHNRLDKRRAAVPLIVTSASDDLNKDDNNRQLNTEQQAKTKSVISLGKMSSTVSGSALIRSEYSSVVRLSNLARYRSELVIVKQLNKSSLSISRDLLVELKSMREFLCDNLAKFIGICMEPNRLAIVYEFCSRGSLQDMLLNQSVSMDWTLKYSIIGDIVNGLNFIHTTLLDYHGRLKSTNLVLDSRFTVKITDFGLQSLYSQLEAIDDCSEDEREDDNDDDDDNGGGENAKLADSMSRQGDQLSTVASAYNMESVSVIGSRKRAASNSQQVRRQRNKGAARYFWTAPEHLREKNVHCCGSKKGDVYSLAVILCEIITRKEPYYYGSSAKPHWAAIKRDRLSSNLTQQQQQQKVSQVSHAQRRSSQLHDRRDSRSQVSAAATGTVSEVSIGNSNSAVGSTGNRRIRRQSKLRSGATVTPVEFAEEPPDSASVASVASSSQQDRSSQRDDLPPTGDSTVAVKSLTTTNSSPPDAEEILDQLRMGIQPEPVRPYLPNYLLQDVNARLIDLMRSCWAEAPQTRPTLAQVRNLLRRITRGVASRNYLDNLLERLQNYAENLEQLVDSKSSDILQEKQRTEELLYQLVPKFVADRLKREQPIVPQLFDGVTIFFSDIVGFEKYASVMSPTEQVDLLNSVYSSFDSIISSFDVTKIETIIDQFLVASGISLYEVAATDSSLPTADSSPVLTKEQQQQQQQPPGELNAQQTGKTSAKTVARKKARGLLANMRRSHGSQVSKGNNSGSLETPLEEAENLEKDADIAEVDSMAGGDIMPMLNQQQLASLAVQNRYKRNCAEQIARMALCIRDLVKSFHFRQALSALKDGAGIAASGFNVRIGIHSGKVCAGIVGAKRPKFCLIGDTVNVASRMHTNSKANKIQISADTRELLEQVPGFSIEPRGKIDVKGKGMMETFWLESSY